MVQPALDRLRAEFLEMPGLRLTAKQVERLCGLDHGICHAVLDALVDTRFLRVGVDGIYARVTEGALPRARPVKVESLPAARQHA